MFNYLEIDAYLDCHLKTLLALADGEEPPAPETGIIPGALMPDYYVRTGSGNPEENPRIQAELKRIWDDYEFVGSEITWEMTGERASEYKE